MYVPAEGEMCNVHHDLDCCGRKFNRLDPHTKGIAEGLRMAAEICTVFLDNFGAGEANGCISDVQDEILAKAKELDEGK